MNETLNIQDTQFEPADYVKLLDEALGLIDGKLTQLPARSIVSANEMSDMLLDLRLLISGARDALQPVEIVSPN